MKQGTSKNWRASWLHGHREIARPAVLFGQFPSIYASRSRHEGRSDILKSDLGWGAQKSRFLTLRTGIRSLCYVYVRVNICMYVCTTIKPCRVPSVYNVVNTSSKTVAIHAVVLLPQPLPRCPSSFRCSDSLKEKVDDSISTDILENLMHCSLHSLSSTWPKSKLIEQFVRMQQYRPEYCFC